MAIFTGAAKSTSYGVLLAACVIAATSAQETGRARGTALIAGRVIDSTSGQTVPYVTVTLRNTNRIYAEITADGKATRIPDPAVITDSQGRFVFGALEAGAFALSVLTRPGTFIGGASVELTTGQQVTDVAVRASRFGSIAGTVRDEAGDPIVGMRVNVFLKKTTGFRPVLQPRTGAVADDHGTFRIGNLPPGDYVLCACSRDALAIDNALLSLLGSQPPSAPALVKRLDDSVPAFAPTFHPASTRLSDAHAVTVGSGDDRAGIDITVRAVTPRRVSGRLSGIAATGTAAFTLLLIAENDRPEAQSITAIAAINVAADGAFGFVAVPPGRYSLEVFPAQGKQDAWASLPVTVGDEDVEGLTVPLWNGATVTGRVEFSGSSPRPDASALAMGRVTLVPADLTARVLIAAGPSGSGSHSVSLDSDGHFRIEGVPPGRYVATASRLGPDWQLTESVRTSEGMSTDPVVTIGNNGLSGVVITMSDAMPAIVLGTVVLDSYEAPQLVNVLVFPAEPASWTEAFRFPGRFAVTSISNERTFRFTGVPPGDYFAMLVDAETNMGPEQFEAWSRRATRISLHAGETKTVALKR